MPVVANEQNERLPNLPAPLLAVCDHAANIFAISGRKGILPPAIQIVAPVHNFDRDEESRKLFPFQTDKFRVAHDPKMRTVVLMTPDGKAWHLHKDEANEIRTDIMSAIWKIRAQERGDTKRKAAKGAR